MNEKDDLIRPMNSVLEGLLSDFNKQSEKMAAITPEMFRGMMKQIATSMDAETPQPVSVKDLKIGKGESIPARCYQPVEEGDYPTILFYHGGGWVGGDLETHDGMCRRLCLASKATVLAVDYRLAPEHPFPAALEDVLEAYDWLLENAVAMHIGNGIIGLCGDSGGANLAAVVAHERSGDKGLVGQVLFYPATNLTLETDSKKRYGRGYMLDSEQMNWFVQQYTGGKVDLNDYRLSVMNADITPDYASTLVITAGYDPLRDEGIAFSDMLKERGVNSTWSCYQEMTHGFAGCGKLPRANEAIEEAGRFFRLVFEPVIH